MIIIDAVYGEQEILDPLALELISAPELQRLKGVNQWGSWNLLDASKFSSRFDHSIGVYLLLRKLGASREEQLAGLLHDISHTAFSHVIDYFYNAASTQHIHEELKGKVWHGSQIPSILKKHGLDSNKIMDESHFPLLERSIPGLCADRVDYFLRDALFNKRITDTDVAGVLSSLVVKDNEIMLSNAQVGKKMALAFMEMTKTFWSPAIPSASFQILADAMKLGLQKGIITEKDFFLEDNALLEKLRQDSEVARKIELVSYKHLTLGSKEDYDIHTTGKARYVDPKILADGDSMGVSEIEPSLAKEIEVFKKIFKDGFYVKVVGGAHHA